MVGAFEKRITRRFDKKQMMLWEILLFTAKFSFFAFFLQILMLDMFEFSILVNLNANATHFILSMFSDSFRLVGNTILFETGGYTVMIDIIKDCTGWKSFMALSGLIVAVRGFGIDNRKRMIGIISGAVAVFFGNIARLTTTIGYGYLYGMENFMLIHDVLWQFGLIIFILAIWNLWLRWCGYFKKTGKRYK